MLRAYLQLVRLPNLFTAAADVLAGYLTVTAVSAGAARAVFDAQDLSWLIVATVCLYAGGVVLNDYFDEAVDRIERPERPLPSGRVSRRAARRLAVGLFVLAALAGASVGPVSLVLTLAIAFSAGLYDAVGKRTSLGPMNMALCRFLNLLLGVSAAPILLIERVHLALLLLVHVAGVTLLSRGEVVGGDRRAAGIMLAAVGTVTAGLTALAAGGFVPDASYLPFLCAYVLVVALPAARAFQEPSARLVGLGVKWGVLGLVLLDAAFAAAFGGLPAGAVVAALLIPSMIIARAVAVT